MLERVRKKRVVIIVFMLQSCFCDFNRQHHSLQFVQLQKNDSYCYFFFFFRNYNSCTDALAQGRVGGLRTHIRFKKAHETTTDIEAEGPSLAFQFSGVLDKKKKKKRSAPSLPPSLVMINCCSVMFFFYFFSCLFTKKSYQNSSSAQ